MKRYSNKVALVTGASTGIGKEIAISLAYEVGMIVIACARRDDLIKEYMRKPNDGIIIPYKCDVKKEEEVKKMFDFINSKYGELSVLVNNAGIGREGAILNGAYENWRDMFDINVFGLSMCTNEGVQIMLETEKKYPDISGVLINIGSIYGHHVTKEAEVHMYQASKFAVKAITEGTRLELQEKKSKIRVGSISPGYCKTSIVDHKGAEYADKLWKSIPNVMLPEDIANTVLYILNLPDRCCIHDIIPQTNDNPV